MSEEVAKSDASVELERLIQEHEWYHTIELASGLVIPGVYDHRPYLPRYGFPTDLHGKTVLDIGAADGFFTFELERRGAQVTAIDIERWDQFDIGPLHEAETETQPYMQTFDLAAQALGSKAARKRVNLYDIQPAQLGLFDLTFCGSVLLHLTDPIRALWQIAALTKEKAIITTAVMRLDEPTATAQMVGHLPGVQWWIPSRAALELMVAGAGFLGIEWHDAFDLRTQAGHGLYHAVIHAYKTEAGWTDKTVHRDALIKQHRQLRNLAISPFPPESMPDKLAAEKSATDPAKPDTVSETGEQAPTAVELSAEELLQLQQQLKEQQEETVDLRQQLQEGAAELTQLQQLRQQQTKQLKQMQDVYAKTRDYAHSLEETYQEAQDYTQSLESAMEEQEIELARNRRSVIWRIIRRLRRL